MVMVLTHPSGLAQALLQESAAKPAPPPAAPEALLAHVEDLRAPGEQGPCPPLSDGLPSHLGKQKSHTHYSQSAYTGQGCVCVGVGVCVCTENLHIYLFPRPISSFEQF